MPGSICHLIYCSMKNVIEVVANGLLNCRGHSVSGVKTDSGGKRRKAALQTENSMKKLMPISVLVDPNEKNRPFLRNNFYCIVLS